MERITRLAAAGIIVAIFNMMTAAGVLSKTLSINCQFSSQKWPRHLSVCLSRVDGRGFFGTLAGTAEQRVEIFGTHTFVLRVRVQTSILETAIETGRSVRATLVKGRRYQTVGTLNGRTVSVWIKDVASGKRVSTVSTFKVKDCRIACLPWKRIEG